MVNFAFIRGSIGPSDYTPTLIPTDVEESTQGSQLAMHILLETGSISLADTIPAYNQSIAKDFIMGLPARYDDVKFLDGALNNYCVLARRAADSYYVAGITINEREFAVDMSFLADGKEYVAEIYYDEVQSSQGGGWSPIVPLSKTAVDEESVGKLFKRSVVVKNTAVLKIAAPENGGFVMKIVEKI